MSHVKCFETRILSFRKSILKNALIYYFAHLTRVAVAHGETI